MDHAHQWRATSKVFALVCECGLVYHEWLVAEVDRLKAPSSASGDDVAVLRIQIDEALAESDKLRAGNASLRAQLDEAKQQLEKQAQEITNHVVSSAAAPSA